MKRLWVVALLILVRPLFAETNSVELRIQAQGNPAAVTALDVNPNDTVSLAADLWGMGGQCTTPGGCPQGKSPSDFLWSSDDRPNAVCDPYNASECAAETNFQVLPTGVQFHVPGGSGQPITISARQRAGDLMSSATLNLKAPVAVQEAPPTPPSQVVVLQQDGHWVVIDGRSYWVPNSYRPDWVPYQHGHWVYVSGDGWTWVSYDPWGAYTDHYGVWRLHDTYGWIWLPFEHPVYHPATVTFFFSGGHIGWSPYYSGWPGAYRTTVGFRDGFRPGMSVSTVVPIGATVVAERNFYSPNIYERRVVEKTQVENIYRGAVTTRSFGLQPGGVNPTPARNWVNNRVKGGTIPVTSSRMVKEPGGTFRTPVPYHPTPKGYPKSRFTSLPQPVRSSGARKPRRS